MPEPHPHPMATAESMPSSAVHQQEAEWLTFESDLAPPLRWREFFAIALCVVLADIVIYRGHGFAGYALLFVLAPLLLMFGSPKPRVGWVTLSLDLLLLALAARMVWLGSGLLVTCGFFLLSAFAMALAGRVPYMLNLFAYIVETIPAGVHGVISYRRIGEGRRWGISTRDLMKVLLPATAAIAFGLLFVLANPDVRTSLAESLERAGQWLHEAIGDFVPTPAEVILWIAVAWFVIGLLRPLAERSGIFEQLKSKSVSATNVTTSAASHWYVAFRNMLLTVIVLFAGYLLFEFKTLWFREFPEGFHYSGYAHEGAAWLTVALALSTVVLSIVFRGSLVADPRLPRLKRLAWIWSAQNVILAIAVYNRLFIYVDFNGMTRMRTVGLFGMTAVLVGFILVVVKIVRGRDFVWLVRRQLWTLALAILLFALTPVDLIVHSYNVERILGGDSAPSVQISVHPIDSGGVYVLAPLTKCEDEIIREGVRAMLAERAKELARREFQYEREGWTSFQWADRMAYRRLKANRAVWKKYEMDDEAREAALERFHDYAYQWY